MAKTRVLIVEDSPFIHKIITRALCPEDFEVCGIGANGKEGVDLFSSLKPDVVTMDITMPVMDGLTATRKIMEVDPQAKILMLSAMGDDALVDEARTIGVRAFLQKPFKPDELNTSIRLILQGEL